MLKTAVVPVALALLALPGLADELFNGNLFTQLDPNGNQTEQYTSDAGLSFAVPFDATYGMVQYVPPVRGSFSSPSGITSGITYYLYSILIPGLVVITDPHCGGCLDEVIDFGNSPYVSVFSSDVDSLSYTPNLERLLTLGDARYGVMTLQATILPDGTIGATYSCAVGSGGPGCQDFGFNSYPYDGVGHLARVVSYEFDVAKIPEPSSVILMSTIMLGFVFAVHKRIAGSQVANIKRWAMERFSGLEKRTCPISEPA